MVVAKKTFLLLVAALVLGACGKQTVTPSKPLVDTGRIPRDVPPALHLSYWPVAAGEPRDAVLNHLNFAAKAITAGAFAPARRALDTAIVGITSVFSNEKNASRALKLWYEEGMKDYKGEPYERAMAFVYRGLLYALEKEYDNARASFEAAYQQDSVAVDSETVADFALALYFKSWAGERMGDQYLADEAWREFAALVSNYGGARPIGKIAIVETGSAPRKLADGVGHYELVYRRGKGHQPNRFEVQGLPLKPAVVEDLFVQAATRGPRPVDRIIKGKAQFMNRALAAGTVFGDLGDVASIGSAVGGVYGANEFGRGAGYASDALGVASSISLLLAVSANPRVDTRYWQGLSDRIYVIQLPPGGTVKHAAFKLSYPDGYSFSQAATETVVALSEHMEWYRVPHRFRYKPPVTYK